MPSSNTGSGRTARKTLMLPRKAVQSNSRAGLHYIFVTVLLEGKKRNAPASGRREKAKGSGS